MSRSKAPTKFPVLGVFAGLELGLLASIIVLLPLGYAIDFGSEGPSTLILTALTGGFMIAGGLIQLRLRPTHRRKQLADPPWPAVIPGAPKSTGSPADRD